MAVYTHINKADLLDLFQSIGEIKNIKGITEGVENTNYLVTLNDNKKLIFTIFEKRTKEDDLPFFNNAMKEFQENGINCPVPLEIAGQNIFKVKDKPCAIYTFIEGAQIQKSNQESIISLASFVSNLHKVGLRSNLKRENNMLKPTWNYICSKFQDYNGEYSKELEDVIKEIKEIESLFPSNIRVGLIHADLFKDNIFFNQYNQVSGIIDFFFTCSDSIVYDLATLVNAWFFKGSLFSEIEFQIFIKKYLELIKWEDKEKELFNFYLKASAIRFFLTRLYDLNFNNHGQVRHKNPNEFYKILNFHKKNNLQNFL
jgi:homoserine kinase type II